jgi:hypothetical protein
MERFGLTNGPVLPNGGMMYAGIIGLTLVIQDQGLGAMIWFSYANIPEHAMSQSDKHG